MYREVLRRTNKVLRLLTSPLRVLPDFIVVGGQRCGTTSLYHYLVAHPSVSPAFTKEVHFFDRRFARGLNWYQAHFPLRVFRRSRRQVLITGEATPYYMFHPHVPRRISALLPEVKLIILLRNPVDRAYSHFHHEVRMGREKLPFGEAVAQEPYRLEGELDKMLDDPAYQSYTYQHFSYLSRGLYVDQIRRLLEFFTEDQVLILDSESFFRNSAAIMKRVFYFLGLPDRELRSTRAFNGGDQDGMDPSLRLRLVKYFEPHNQRLFDLLGTEFHWA